jgi:sugar lactone lactonase YvrE
MKRTLQLFILLILSVPVLAQYTSTISGDKNASGNSSNVTLAAAKWFQPHSMCADGNGNIWVTDDGNHNVKLIRAGMVYTRVGSATATVTFGYANAFSIAASFHTPRGIVADANNDLYVCDYFNHAIRKVTAFTSIGSSQEVTTLAGAPETTGTPQAGNSDGTGTNARFDGPYGICRDNSGNLYVTDDNNNNIRKIVISTGVVTTLCGNASGTTGGLVDGNYATAKFKYPRGIAYSATENALYVNDFGNGRIRKIDLTAQTVTVWAGGINGFMGSDGDRINAVNIRNPEGIILDKLGNQIFTSGVNANTIRRVEKSTNKVFTFAGQHQIPDNTDGLFTAALFDNPTGLVFASDSVLYIADNSNGIIRAIDMKPQVDFTADYTTLATGAISTIHDTTLSMVTSYNYTISPGSLNVDYQFVNSTSATSKNPAIKFLNPGTYTITSKATNPYGTGTKTRTGYIVVSNSTGAPTADFIADKLFGTTTTTFTFTNQTTNSTSCSYAWVFAPTTISYLNSTTQNSTNPVVSFSAVGFYSVTLNVTHPTFTNIPPKVRTNYIQITNVGIKEVKNDFLFNIFPNPTQGNFTLISSQSLNHANAIISDAQGRTITTISLQDSQEQNVSLPKLASGIYFIKIIAEDKIATQRIVVSH